MVYAAVVLVFLSSSSLAMFLGLRKKEEKIDVARRLGPVVGEETPVDVRHVELKKSFTSRALKPVLAKLSGLSARLLPAVMVKSLEPRLVKAGSPGGLSAGEFLTIKLFLATSMFLIPVFLKFTSPLVLLLFFIGWQLPDLYLKMRIKKRMEEIEKTLPDILDLLTVSVEAGLGFDGAMAKVAEKSHGLLAEEFKKVLKEIRMGKSRREALKDMAQRLDSGVVTVFVGAVIQADQLGISFGQIMRVQSEQTRHKRRQQVEEAAIKAPVKMLFPLIFFIFPTIFIVLLGPAIIKIITALF